MRTASQLTPLRRSVNVDLAYAMLQNARDLLKAAGAVQTAKRVRAAIKSAEGAVRHARARDYSAYLAHRQAEREK